jgi:hypothetical protein
MADLKFIYNWLASGNDAPELRQTMAMLEMHVGNVNLMKNQDVWSKTIREPVLVSAYPLAMWLTSVWWRLIYEPLPAHGVLPSVDWRMAHEIGAANHGFVWPRIIFASDHEVMQVWAVPLDVNENQSVRYLNGLEMPAAIMLSDFQIGVDDFIAAVLDRLNALGCQGTELSNLRQLLQEERGDPESVKYRRLEAEMGYDPDECPEELMKKALMLDKKIGTVALSELAPVYGKSTTQKPLVTIEEIADSPGLIGVVHAPRIADGMVPQGAPWQRAVAAAGALRRELGNQHGLMDNAKLCELLGLNASEVEQWAPVKRNDVAIAVPNYGNHYKFIPRKKHPIAKRFELARFLGDYLLTEHTGQWIASTDLSTTRQKHQRAFAAEFLCPIATLRDFLQEDYSETAIEDAADYFQVSSKTVESMLVNNGLLSPAFLVDYTESRLPYMIQ